MTHNKTKVVVRNLPCGLTEEEFKSAVVTWLPTVDWWYFVPGHKSAKQEMPAKAYLHFASFESLSVFHTSFEGHTFVDPRGKEYKCSVEYAPFQRVPKKQPKPDVRQATIEEDPEYKLFVEQLQKGPEYLPSAEAQYEDRKKKEEAEKPKTTPILEELKARGQAKQKQRPPSKRGQERRKGKTKRSENSDTTDTRDVPVSVLGVNTSATKDERTQANPGRSNRSGGRGRRGRGPSAGGGNTGWKETSKGFTIQGRETPNKI